MTTETSTATLTITHTHEAGTLIEGTSKGDGTAPILKGNGWRWGRSIAAWFVPMSRDRQPKMYVINRTTAALTEAGFTVKTDVDRTSRSTAEVEAGKIARQQDRADALAVKAERKQDAETVAGDSARAALRRLPEGGEPIKIGHHSENRHRRAIATADKAMGKSVQATEAAKATAERAAIAARTTDRRYSPAAVASRIKTLETGIRAKKRKIEGSSHTFAGGYVETTSPATGDYRVHLQGMLADELDQLTYWQGIRENQIAQGQATNYTREQISTGDYVRIGGSWHQVARVNQKTVSLITEYSWTQKADYAQIRDHRTSEEAAAAAAHGNTDTQKHRL
ncbi:DUF3560 domain-containing protein [Arthrobacter sp. H20]|uniref:DUF3560 domain-containing protein n=1 Tax=Arthrobacter sp. H20 TaxID=1267981 RepID=UPI0004BCAAD6|nr:DUF3560 domain-containing protein [Arthrobacter sp. H20]